MNRSLLMASPALLAVVVVGIPSTAWAGCFGPCSYIAAAAPPEPVPPPPPPPPPCARPAVAPALARYLGPPPPPYAAPVPAPLVYSGASYGFYGPSFYAGSGYGPNYVAPNFNTQRYPDPGLYYYTRDYPFASSYYSYYYTPGYFRY